MKLSEIFRRTVARENDSPAPKTEVSQRQTAQERLASANESGDKAASDEGLATAVEEQKDAETSHFQPPRSPLPEGYFYPDAKESASLHAELLRELSADHPLFGVPLETFAARQGNEDALFRFRGNPRRFVLVHLIWPGAAETKENHPSVLFDGSFAEFLEREQNLFGLQPPL